MKGVEDIDAALAKDQLPPVCQRRVCSAGHWVEFDDALLTGPFSQLRPVVWFRFLSKDNAHHDANPADDGWDHSDEEFDFEDAASDNGSADGTMSVGDVEEYDFMEDWNENPQAYNQAEHDPDTHHSKDLSSPPSNELRASGCVLGW